MIQFFTSIFEGSIPNVGVSTVFPLTREVPRDEAEGEKKGTKALIKPFLTTLSRL